MTNNSKMDFSKRFRRLGEHLQKMEDAGDNKILQLEEIASFQEFKMEDLKAELEEVKSKLQKKAQDNSTLRKDLKQLRDHDPAVLTTRINDLIARNNWLEYAEKENEAVKQATIKKDQELQAMKEALASLEYYSNGIKKGDDEIINELAALYADFNTVHYDLTADYLENKKRPAKVRAQEVKDLKAETKLLKENYRLMQYRFEAIVQLFPELEFYMESFDAIKELENIKDLSTLQDDFDRVQNFMSKDEYLALDEIERNQVALEKYINGNKSNWQIGRDYEMYCGYMLQQEGYLVNYFGIEQRLEDMGRDLIAVKDNIHYVIQCKYWAKGKVIREKHITQIFGTAIEYELANTAEMALLQPFDKVVPVFITNITLSDTAERFAARLGVEVRAKERMKEFPRIKCNSGKDERGGITKIYHLPFDQQYDRTVISNPGDSYAFSVKEAVENGYRRAFKYRWRK